ncbi:1-(5-phosphoribosyl)-5-[(5-phosphoribosylamino)methylideneamino]imidazole-4-carboxamide isomerase [Oceanicaulis alexandrii]|uniref:1-(5-phosphoribosyl)-5-[(5- phosphoribosylamino)methylideneamino]imidazole-4- carboxamide isomerase n=1 Tax=Oceanicaulis alexandrii TaxID=153233 RepID=UPI0003B73486|nr:1-(5-phosphoribosyl)-5-[(5-phosphoribosylamino)methylideneamino]imidazole-4-carboxamide isomerase [Oceanicaulis alexandrii]
MIVYPAIDVLDGRVVRLAKGDFDAVTEYGDNPVAVAEQFKSAGADWLHLVDLSGARDGARRQQDLVRAIAGVGLKVQTGGGVRSREDVDAILNAGASRAVIGSLAVSDPQTVIGWIAEYGAEQIAAAFDVKIAEDGVAYPTLKGWTEQSVTPLADLLSEYRLAGLSHALATDVARDGMLEGPNLELYEDLAQIRPDMNWQASGGVSSLDDLRALKANKLSGVIIGRALFEGRFTLEEALAC